MKQFLTFLIISIYSIAIVKASDTYIEKEQPAIDFLTGKASISLDAKNKKVTGTVTYTMTVEEPTETVFIDAQKMVIHSVTLDGVKANYSYDDKKIRITNSLKKGKQYTLKIQYEAQPQKALYFLKDYQGNDQIWTQGQGKYSSNWIPSFDDMNEKVIFDLTIRYHKDYEVIANGKLQKKEMINDSIQSWTYDMKDPMSSYLLAMVVGKYDKIVETSKSGIPLEMYYYPADKDMFESTYAHSTRIFNFLEETIGVPFPWQNYKQIPVKDFLYAGMENTGTTIFSDAFVVDEVAYQDRNYINVNAHELAHQWFGDLVTETEGKHHWLQEGFATYYALLAEKEIFGSDHFYYKLYESAEQLTAASEKKEATSLLDAKATSLTFYQRGAWALFALENEIGATNFKIAINNYLETHRFKNVNTDDFITIVEEVSGKDMSLYRKLWLEQVAFPSQEALEILAQIPFIKNYLSLAKERTQPLAGKWGTLARGLDGLVNDFIGQEVIYQLQGETSPEAIALYDKAFDTDNLIVRQTIGTTMNTIPKSLKKQFESLLSDASYATKEAALYHLWVNFPNDRASYLDQTKDVIGFSDKNVRTLWLVLALSTKGYHIDKHQDFYSELSAYTSPAYHFSTRENAFSYLESLGAFSDASLAYLIEGATHHNWRFRNFCRKIVDNLLKDSKYQKKYVALKDRLSEKQQAFLERKLTPK
ncbi:M1 family metallopeptidase [Aquimarina hainanensis]|uniref:Aminopeptidase N n=1 Tax=Aquimarina hainanensis TaxID=1578017 RepID=A0ABW5NFM2_9FLAO